jgi:hypothetical protein
MRHLGEVERLDVMLAERSQAETPVRLRLGQALEVLGRGGHLDLGFSSVAAYSLERCDRSVRWVEAARRLARRLENLPELRRAMAFGSVSWSMGELLAGVARPQDEARWLETARSRTVRQMRGLAQAAMAEASPAERAACGSALDEHNSSTTVPHDTHDRCTLTCTVDQEEAWLFEATRTLLEQLGVHGADAQMEALLSEGQATLLEALPAGTLDMQRAECLDTAQQRWLRQLARWRDEAEARCEDHIRGPEVDSRKPESIHRAVGVAAALGIAALQDLSCHDLDATLRGLSQILARHELELSQLLLQFHRSDGWRRLGYATEAQYARERLGISRSSMRSRRVLALRLEKLPHVAAALGSGQIGVEAALQVVRVATVSTQAAWVERAQRRTIKYLREEVVAALIAIRMSGEANCPPPYDADMTAFHELERAVVTGRACRQQAANDTRLTREIDSASMAKQLTRTRLVEPTCEGRRAWLFMLGSLGRWLDGGVQMSAARGRAPACRIGSTAGRIALRFRVSRSTYNWWRSLEAQARRRLPCGVSWLKFLCLAVWESWRHVLDSDVAYRHIYIRDRYRCVSPVCCRKDVTPHHLEFRSAGGADTAINTTAMCTWCHLYGVHGGHIRAVGTADLIHWELGAPGRPCLVVHGRERVAA